MEETDGELITLTRGGQKEAFSRLIRRHQARAERVAYGVVGNETDAQEVAQEALLQAYLSLDRLREPERFASWLHGIVLNVGRYYVRAEQRHRLAWDGPAPLLDATALSAPDPAQIVELRERERRILEAVQALSPANREATRLFYYEQMNVQEVAGALGVSAGAVKVRLHQSRKQLRERLRSFYPEEMTKMPATRLKKKMIPVAIVTVGRSVDARDHEDPTRSEALARRFLMKTIMAQAPGQTYDWVGLVEESSQRFLPMHAGWDTRAIAAVQEGTSPDVAPALALMVSLLKATDSRLEEVRIEPLSEEILHATLKVRRNASTRDVDARPGDGIGLAVQAGTPLYLAEEIMQRRAWDLADPIPIVQRLQPAEDEASLRKAIADPFLVRLVEGMIAHAVRYLHAHRDCSTAEVVIAPNGEHFTQITYRAADNSYSRTAALPPAMRALVVARFKSIASLDLAERSAPQHGSTVLRHGEQDYNLSVSTEPGEFSEQLTLRFEVRAAQDEGRRAAQESSR